MPSTITDSRYPSVDVDIKNRDGVCKHVSDNHVCTFYKTDQDRQELLVTYFIAAVALNEKVFYFADESRLVAIRKDLQAAGVDVCNAEKKTQLCLVRWQDAYLNMKGLFDANKSFNKLLSICHLAASENFAAVRIAGDCTGLAMTDNVDELVKYEQLLHNSFKDEDVPLSDRVPLKAMCMYDARCCDQQFLRRALDCHPSAASFKRWQTNHSLVSNERDPNLQLSLWLRNLSDWREAIRRSQEQTQRLLSSKQELLLAKQKLAEEVERRMSVEQELLRREKEYDEARKRTETAAQWQTDFLATVSHELKTPLNSILMSALALSDIEEARLSPAGVDMLNTVHLCSDHLLSLISELLDWSKFEAGRLKLEPEPFDLLSCVRDSICIAQGRLEGKPLQLWCSVDPDVPACVVGDPLRVRQVLVNLVSNGIKFTEEGSVSVSVHSAPSKQPGTATVAFEVTDTGMGIAEEEVDIIFCKFVQVGGSKSRQCGGVGLGLPICKELISLMGGTISVRSRLGEGSVFSFTMTFDVAEAPQHPVSSQATSHMLVSGQSPLGSRISSFQQRRQGSSFSSDRCDAGHRSKALVSDPGWNTRDVTIPTPEQQPSNAARAEATSVTGSPVPSAVPSSRPSGPTGLPVHAERPTGPAYLARRHSVNHRTEDEHQPITDSHAMGSPRNTIGSPSSNQRTAAAHDHSDSNDVCRANPGASLGQSGASTAADRHSHHVTDRSNRDAWSGPGLATDPVQERVSAVTPAQAVPATRSRSRSLPQPPEFLLHHPHHGANAHRRLSDSSTLPLAIRGKAGIGPFGTTGLLQHIKSGLKRIIPKFLRRGSLKPGAQGPNRSRDSSDTHQDDVTPVDEARPADPRHQSEGERVPANPEAPIQQEGPQHVTLCMGANMIGQGSLPGCSSNGELGIARTRPGVTNPPDPFSNAARRCSAPSSRDSDSDLALGSTGGVIARRLSEFDRKGPVVTVPDPCDSDLRSDLSKRRVAAVTIPTSRGCLVMAPSPRTAHVYPEVPEGERRRILLAEDNLTNQKLQQRVLQKLGYEVEVASNGKEAVVAALTRPRFDLILMDILMPEMDGLEATRQILAQSEQVPKTPIVALSASAVEDIQGRCMESGFSGIMHKPFKVAVLREQLEQYMTTKARTMTTA